MSIKFTKNEMKSASFGNLSFGDSFMPTDYANYIQIKAQPFKQMRDEDDNAIYNAICINDGSFDIYEDSDTVYPVNATLTLEK
jgi:hypothetical protein